MIFAYESLYIFGTKGRQNFCKRVLSEKCDIKSTIKVNFMGYRGKKKENFRQHAFMKNSIIGVVGTNATIFLQNLSI